MRESEYTEEDIHRFIRAERKRPEGEDELIQKLVMALLAHDVPEDDLAIIMEGPEEDIAYKLITMLPNDIIRELIGPKKIVNKEIAKANRIAAAVARADTASEAAANSARSARKAEIRGNKFSEAVFEEAVRDATHRANIDALNRYLNET